ncbi:MAG TPA: hypothetical protein DIV86_01535 [Alphaproteobacteria bacterium]|nr:hypothetical protein [Alphaproteobacteria bacterium]
MLGNSNEKLQISNCGNEPLILEIPYKCSIQKGKKYIQTNTTKEIKAQFDNLLIKAITTGFELNSKIVKNKGISITELSKQEKMDKSYASKLIRLTTLCPDIINAILSGKQPRKLTVSSLLQPFPKSWIQQR